MRRVCFAFAVITFTVASVPAALKTTTPSQACGLMAQMGMPTRGWNQYGGIFGCTSPYKELGEGLPLANNIAYYVDGTSKTVTQVQLVLNVNYKATYESAHQELLLAARKLTVSVSGEALPPALEAAITKGISAKAKVGISMVDVVRENWPTGKGYEIRVTIQ